MSRELNPEQTGTETDIDWSKALNTLSTIETMNNMVEQPLGQVTTVYG